MPLHRYWLTFDLPSDDVHPIGVHLGCGVTAFDLDDALRLAQERIWRGATLPGVSHVTEHVDVTSLDPGHVRPNIGDVTARGVWYPLGYT